MGKHILDVALAEFIRLGVNGARMDMIAAVAQVTKRTLYQRYGSKGGLLRAILEQGIEETRHAVSLCPSKRSLRAKLLYIAGKMLDKALTTEAIGFESLMLQLATIEPELANQIMPVAHRAWPDLFRTILKDEPALTDLDEDTLTFTANHLFDVLVMAPRSRILFRRNLENSAAAKKAYHEHAMTLLAAGFPFLRADPTAQCQPSRMPM
ncbi:TetR/AcrR family transcriptional regulator [Sphingobium sp.]|uniref:TetR/AcrR family transcriptional regulator n=1 Tax=Sphingobium sp. TaxID=1912891 RepID=UPI00257BCBB0|nr:TetR/AcrR family transcriptional regulator [Sphingobium sp.]